MATYRKTPKGWRAEVCKRGVRKSRAFTTKAAAQAWATKLEAEIDAGYRGEPVRKSLREALEKYRDEISPTKRGERWEVVRINKFLASIKFVDYPLSSITAMRWAEWRDEQLKTLAPGSVRREFNLLASVLEACRREWHWITTNPLRDVRRPSNPPARRRGVTQDEIDAITKELGYTEDGKIDSLSQEVAAAFLLAIETGMRAGEILKAEYDLDGRVARLQVTKNGDSRAVPLSLQAVEIVRRVQAFTVSSSSLDSLFRKARKAAGIEDLHFHDSRSEAITRLARKLSVVELARMIGHRDLKSLMSYYAENPKTIAEKLD